MGKTYTVKQVADILGFSTNSIYSFLKAGRLTGIRVGKGRFRISEEELARVMHLSKRKTEHVTEGVVDERAVVAVPQPPMIRSVPHASLASLVLGRAWTAPKLFDWTVGFTSVISGIGLFLFNRTVQPAAGIQFEVFMPYIRWILIAAGLGLLTGSAVTTEGAWRRFFYSLLAILGFVNTITLMRSGDVNGAVLYGVMAVLAGAGAWSVSLRTLGLSVYVSLVALFTPFVVMFGSNDYHVTTFLRHYDLPRLGTAIIVAIGSGAFLGMYWFGYARKSAWFGVASVAASFVCILAGVYNAELSYWSRAFFLLTIAFLILFHPVYRGIDERGTKRVRWLMQGLFALVGVLMAGAVTGIALLQGVVWDQQIIEYVNKTTYGAILVNESVSSVKATLLTASKNPEILEALEASDSATLETQSKVMYDGNTNIRRLVFVDRNGNGVALYPHGTFDQMNLSFRNYFTRVQESGQPYVSELYTALADKASRKVVSVSVPLTARDGQFLGVLTGSVDLLKIGTSLQSLAVGARRERYVVADGEGKVIISQDPFEIGTLLPQEDSLRKALDGRKGAELSRMLDGTLALATYERIPNSTWVISMRVPAGRVYSLNQTAVMTIFGVVGIVLLASLLWIHVLHVHVTARLPEGPGP